MRTLIVVDMQNDFIDGCLGTAEAQSVVGSVAEKIAAYKSRGDEVIFTRDTHGVDYLSTPEGRMLPVEHCIKDTFGWQISDKLDTSYLDRTRFVNLKTLAPSIYIQATTLHPGFAS